jgi:hypothetical protein
MPSGVAVTGIGVGVGAAVETGAGEAAMGGVGVAVVPQAVSRMQIRSKEISFISDIIIRLCSNQPI